MNLKSANDFFFKFISKFEIKEAPVLSIVRSCLCARTAGDSHLSHRHRHYIATRPILTSTKNASLIFTDFLSMIYKMNSHVLLLHVEVERCWKMTLIWYAGDALFRWRHTGSTDTWRHCASIAYDFNLNLHPFCAADVLLINEQILDHFSNSCACE